MLRLRDDDTDWGLTREENARRMKQRIRETARARAAAARKRDERGHFIANAPSIEMPKPGAVFMTAHGPAYQVVHMENPISLPWVSILGSKA